MCRSSRLAYVSRTCQKDGRGALSACGSPLGYLGGWWPRLGPGLEQNRHRLEALDDADAEGHEADAPRLHRRHRPLDPPRLRHTCAAPDGEGAQPGGGAARVGRPARIDLDREVERGLRLVDEHRVGPHAPALPRRVGRAHLHMCRWAGGDCAGRQSKAEALVHTRRGTHPVLPLPASAAREAPPRSTRSGLHRTERVARRSRTVQGSRPRRRATGRRRRRAALTALTLATAVATGGGGHEDSADAVARLSATCARLPCNLR
eukprot:scaffold115001_cov69-Phaeocystis_antarctica.AAC.2